MKIYDRNLTMDVLRLVASFGVIAIHVKSSTPGASLLNTFFWPLCVPFFYLVSSSYFISGLDATKSVGLVIGRLVKRIVIPYIIWTILYIILFQTKGFITGRWREFDWLKVVFYGESAVQLYFLPTLLFIHSISLTFFLLIVKREWVYGLISSGLCITYYYYGMSNGAAGFEDKGSFIGILYFCFMGFFLSKRIKVNKSSTLLTFCGIILVFFAVSMNYFGNRLYILDYPLIFLFGATGVVLIGIGIVIKKLPRLLSIVVPLSFGIYLCHIVFLECFEFLVESKIKHLVYDFKMKLTLVFIVFIVSSVFVHIAMKFKIFKRLLFGEAS